MSKQHHVDEQTLREFLDGSLGEARVPSVVEHLLSGCGECQELSTALWHRKEKAEEPEKAESQPLPESSEPIPQLDVTPPPPEFEEQIARERDAAPGLADALERHPADRLDFVIRNTQRYSTFGLAEYFLDRAAEELSQDKSRAIELGSTALGVAESLSDRYPEPFVNDLKARANAQLAQAHRENGDKDLADELLAKSERFLQAGSGSPQEYARLDSLWGAASQFDGDYEEAHRRFDRAFRIHQEHGTPLEQGRALRDRGTAAYYLERPENALEDWRRSLDLFGEPQGTEAELVILHNMAFVHLDLSQLGEAEETIQTAQDLLGDRDVHPLLRARLQRLSATLAHRREEFAEAERLWRDSRDRFIEEGVGHDAAEISLELALHFHRQGRTDELDELRDRIVPILQLRDVKQGVLAALILFKQAVQNGTATLEMLEELLEYVEEARPRS